VVKTLANFGANVNNMFSDGSTPLYVAAIKGHVGVIKLLYKLGADMKQDVSNCSLKQAAETRNHPEALALIEKILAKMTSECECCGSSSKRLKVCSKCEKVRYCSVECQKQDHNKHKKECKPKHYEDA
jgi:hypothetical protein